MNDRGLTLANSKFATYAKIEENRREEEKLALEKRKAPFTEKVLAAQANYYNANAGAKTAAGNKLSDVDQNKAQEAANMAAWMSGLKPGTQEFENFRNQKYQEEILKRAAGANYVPGVSPTAGTGGVEFLGFK
jgi:hypothetical protein